MFVPAEGMPRWPFLLYGCWPAKVRIETTRTREHHRPTNNHRLQGSIQNSLGRKMDQIILDKSGPSDLHFSLHPANSVEHLEKLFSTETCCMKTLEQIEFGHVRCEGDTCLKLNVWTPQNWALKLGVWQPLFHAFPLGNRLRTLKANIEPPTGWYFLPASAISLVPGPNDWRKSLVFACFCCIKHRRRRFFFELPSPVVGGTSAPINTCYTCSPRRRISPPWICRRLWSPQSSKRWAKEAGKLKNWRGNFSAANKRGDFTNQSGFYRTNQGRLGFNDLKRV